MSAAQITRRRMLGAGSALAVGVLLGTPKTLGALPSMEPEQANAFLAILNRPNEAERFATYYATCECRDCAAVRARSYQCGACGFDGVPLVFPCECARQWDEFTQTNADMLRAVKGKQWVEIAAFQRRLRRGGRPTRCTPGKIQCAHTETWCPVCGDCGSGEPFEGLSARRSAAQVIRDLRALLLTGGD